jgi:hypothetical protein
MKHLLYDLQFILRNWRYFHAHGVLGRELREWWNDYESPASPVHADCRINMSQMANRADQVVADLRRHAKWLAR